MNLGGRNRGALIATLVVFALLATPSLASAKRGLTTGFVDSGQYELSTPSARATWLGRTVAANAGIIRLEVIWSSVAGAQRPADPANPASASYNFAPLDAAVRDIEARGLSVLMNVRQAPAWAEGPGRPASADPGTWEPNPSDLAEFMRAIAARYSGAFDGLPAVQAVQVWNEPNLPQYLNPQYNGQAEASPGIYRDLLNASYAAVKAVNPRMLVVTAGTGPYGDPPGGARLRPVDFWRQVFSAPTRFDVLAHHPIDTSGGPTRSAINHDDASTPDLGRVVRVLRAAERGGTALPGRHPVWATEIWWDSKPPDSAGSPLGRQARWLEQSLYLVWKAGADVVINLEIGDATTGFFNALGGSASGIYFADGRPKPSAVAFAFPFVASKAKGGALRAWGKAPAAGRLAIQARGGGHWRTVRRLRVRPGEVFLTNLGLSGRQHLRAKVAGHRSLVWNQR